MLHRECEVPAASRGHEGGVRSMQFIQDGTRITLYTDPYNGNEIKLGGFSGL